MDIAAIRSQIATTQHTRYFNTGWAGPMPAPVLAAVNQQLQLEQQYGPSGPPARDAYTATIPAARQAFARVLGADEDEVALTENTTRGLNIVLSGLGLRLQSGDEVVTSDTEHHSGLVPLYEFRRRLGVNVKFVNLDGAQGTAGILNALSDAITPRTRLMVLSHIMYTTGLCLPIAEIQKLATSKGVLLVVDAAQCPGQIPLDMHAWGCDFYAIPGHKWLLGPTGTGALYVRRDLVTDLPPLHSSLHAAAKFDAKGGYEPRIAEASKYELSSFSGPLLAGASAACDFVLDLGVEAIAERWQLLARRFRDGLKQVPGVRLVSPDGGELACGLVVFSIDGWPSAPVADLLWERDQIVVRAVPDPSAIRASVGFYNTEEEVDRFIAAVRQIASERPPA